MYSKLKEMRYKKGYTAKEVAEIMTSIMKDTGEKLVGIKMKCDEEFMFRWGEPIDIQEVL